MAFRPFFVSAPEQGVERRSATARAAPRGENSSFRPEGDSVSLAFCSSQKARPHQRDPALAGFLCGLGLKDLVKKDKITQEGRYLNNGVKMADTKIGRITHYFDKIAVGIIKLDEPLKKGETIKIGEVEQPVDSMQVDHQDIDEGKPGQEIGVKVSQKVREGDEVYKVE